MGLGCEQVLARCPKRGLCFAQIALFECFLSGIPVSNEVTQGSHDRIIWRAGELCRDLLGSLKEIAILAHSGHFQEALLVGLLHFLSAGMALHQDAVEARANPTARA